MPDIERIATGVPGLDVLTHGGLPARRATLVVGRSGTGKTILALQTAAHLVRSGHPTLVVAVEEPPADLVATGDSLGFEFTTAIADGCLAFTDVTRPGEGPYVR